MAGFGETNKSNKRKISHLHNNFNENQILNKAVNYHYAGNILEASKLYKFLIDKGSKNSTIFTNYGLILISIRRIKEAEFYVRKAID